MRISLLVGCLLFTTLSIAQNNWSAHAAFGLNRIGLLYDVQAGYQANKHSFEFGMRYYQPDLVFEKEIIGLSLNYDFTLAKFQKYELAIGLGMDFFTEQKGNNRLCLYDPRFSTRLNRIINNKLIFDLKMSTGWVINQLSGTDLPEQKVFTYINYEVSIGLIYRFGSDNLD